jgi:hypothetical protein
LPSDLPTGNEEDAYNVRKKEQRQGSFASSADLGSNAESISVSHFELVRIRQQQVMEYMFLDSNQPYKNTL